MTQLLHPSVAAYLEARLAEAPARVETRTAQLAPLIAFIGEHVAAKQPAPLHFICTHNSRRSLFGQVWARAAAEFMGIGGVTTYSGGSEVTAANPRALAALERAGCLVTTLTPSSVNEANPRHYITIGPRATICAFSKLFDDAANPRKDFAAVMTCTDADEKCPYLPGATRISLPYDDPKCADGTPDESLVYDQRCGEIATDMLEVMKSVRVHLDRGFSHVPP